MWYYILSCVIKITKKVLPIKNSITNALKLKGTRIVHMNLGEEKVLL